VGFEW
jgi:SAM-dependent methyltransferase